MPEPAVIENDVPEPIRRWVKSYGVDIDLRKTIRELQAGQSFVVDTEAGRRAALDAGYALKMYVKTRKIEMGRYRIWRKTQ